MSGCELHAFREAGHAVVLGRVGCDPTLHFLKRGPAGRNRFALAAELRLAAGASEEHHELRCDPLRDIASEILLNESQSWIQSRCNAGRGAQATVLDMNGVLIDSDGRVMLCKLPRD